MRLEDFGRTSGEFWGLVFFDVPNIRKAYSALSDIGASSLKTDMISRKSSNVQSPSRVELKIQQILSPKGFTFSAG